MKPRHSPNRSAVKRIAVVYLPAGILLFSMGCKSSFQAVLIPDSINNGKLDDDQKDSEHIPCKEPLTTAQREKFKFFPGHYVAIGSGRTVQARLTDTLAEIDSELPAVVGIQKRYYWSVLHGPGPDDFNFDQVLADLDEVERSGKKLSIMIMWKFRGDEGENPVPVFLRSLNDKNGPGQYELNSDGEFANGFIANLGNPIVSRQLIRMLHRLAKEVDARSSASSIVYAESAMGLQRENFNPPMSAEDFRILQDSYVDGHLWVTQQSSCIFKHTPVLPLTNFPLRRVDEFTDSYLKWGNAMGGPDVWIDDPTIEPTYDLYSKVIGKVPIGMIVAGGNYLYREHKPETLPEDQRGPYLLTSSPYFWDPNETVIELSKKARTRLSANYLFWKKNGDFGDIFYAAFKNEIKKIGTDSQTIQPTVQACPSKFAGICVNR